ncbi:MAG: OmpA family protein, partial [bacterium]|nr:OmpA family protein [bacterium]
PTGAGSSEPGTSSTTLGGDVNTSQGPVRLQGSGCSVAGGGGGFSMLFWWLFLIFSIGFVPKVWGLNADLYRNSSDGLGFFTLESEETLKKNQYSLGLSQYIVHSPLNFGLQQTGQTLDNVVNYFYVWQMWGAYGLFDDFDVGINFPVSLVSQVENLDSSQERNTSSVGDIRLNAKWEIFKKMAVLGYLQLPSGNTNDIFGEGTVTGGVKAVADNNLGPHPIGVNLGVYARGEDDISASNISLLQVGPAMTWGLGWRWLFSRAHQWYLASNVWGQTDFQGVATSPAEWDWGLQKRWDQGIEGSLGMGFGIGKGYGAPAYRIILGINYVPERVENRERRDGEQKTENRKPLPVGAQAKLEGKEIVILQPVHFETNRAVIRQQSYPILNSVADLLKQNQTILKVRIEGHTDNEGSDRLNLRLSQERAEAVKKYLIRQGISANRLQARGWGEKHPQVPNNSAFNKAKNRRVEFRV